MSLSNSINAVPKPFQGVWEGRSKIVIGIDIGTTQTGVSFAFLEEGENQVIHNVTQWPGQTSSGMPGRIPTLVWYNHNGEAVSFGAEATVHRTEAYAQNNGWQLAKHFKLHLHPSDIKTKHGLKVDPLPRGVSLQRIYSDFLGYILRHTQSFFESRMVDGKNIWEKHRSEMEFVIAHPNGWGIRQQTFLREAAAVAGLSAYSPSRNNIRFVTEAEASVHFCIYHTNLGSRLQTNTTFAVCDAGGSTVDTTVYSVMAARPILRIREVKSSACVQAGAIFVDAAAEKYLRAVFTEASLPYEDIDDYTARGVKDFEHSVKRNFCDSAGDQAVEITGSRINHPSIGIQSGRMALSESVVESFFEDCVNEITASVDDQIKETNVSYMLLVGGFGDSPFLLQRFRTRYEPRGCQVTQLANNSMSKAVADGAIIWNNMSSVVGRAPRSSFGTQTTEPYDPSCPQHRGRGVYTCPSGYDRVIGHWSQIVEKGVVIDARAEARESFHRNYSFPDPHLECFETVLYSYPGVGIPRWVTDSQGRLYDGFQKSCTVRADLTNLSGMLEPKTGHNGRKYWRLDYHICIRFGGTELEAYIEWENDGTMYRGEAAIIPE